MSEKSLFKTWWEMQMGKIKSTFKEKKWLKWIAIGLSALILLLAIIIPVSCSNRASKGLEYEWDRQKGYYVVTDVGECRDKHIVIPDEYKDVPVGEIDSNAFRNCKWIKSVVIGDNVIKVGGFDGCENLKEVTFGKSVGVIWANAFSGCDSLQKVVFKDRSGFFGSKGSDLEEITALDKEDLRSKRIISYLTSGKYSIFKDDDLCDYCRLCTTNMSEYRGDCWVNICENCYRFRN